MSKKDAHSSQHIDARNQLDPKHVKFQNNNYKLL
jgi:hypothetical protein